MHVVYVLDDLASEYGVACPPELEILGARQVGIEPLRLKVRARDAFIFLDADEILYLLAKESVHPVIRVSAVACSAGCRGTEHSTSTAAARSGPLGAPRPRRPRRLALRRSNLYSPCPFQCDLGPGPKYTSGMNHSGGCCHRQTTSCRWKGVGISFLCPPTATDHTQRDADEGQDGERGGPPGNDEHELTTEIIRDSSKLRGSFPRRAPRTRAYCPDGPRRNSYSGSVAPEYRASRPTATGNAGVRFMFC